MTEALPKPSDDQPSISRALALWRAQQRGDAPLPEAGERLHDEAPDRSFMAYAPYALAAALVLGVGAAAASLATAPAMTDSIETVNAVDARSMGLATNLDPTGQQKKAAAISRDVGSMKSEITRLQRALDQSRAAQASLTKQSAGQAAVNQDEVKSLKGEIANLQKTLETTRGESASKIESLSAKVDQSKDDAARVAELRERLDRMERQTAERQSSERLARAEPAPETTGSVSRGQDGRLQEPRAPEPQKASSEQPSEAKRDPAGPVVRNWVVREVVRGVALLEGRNGMIEVVRGARAPGIGRVKSIERRDGQWVVVTDRGIVLERTEL